MTFTRSQYRNGEKIVRWWKKQLIDPITYEYLKRPFFKLGDTLYNALTLRDWLLQSGDLRNPLTQRNISKEDIYYLSIITGTSFNKKLLKMKRDNYLAEEELREFYMREIMDQVYMYLIYSSKDLLSAVNIIGNISYYILKLPIPRNDKFYTSLKHNVLNLIPIYKDKEKYIKHLHSKIELTIDVSEAVSNSLNAST